jgi:DNA repair protein SbcD/Mre11
VKIAHLADTHIGMENYGRLNPETGLNQRLHDFLRTLDQAIDGALREQVDVVVFAGDIYKTRDPTPTHQREFATRIRKLSQRGVHTVIVAGNHDLPMASARATSVDIFKALEIERVTVARVLGLHRIETTSGPLQVVAFPWTVRSSVLTQPEYKNHTLAQLNELMIQLSVAKLQEEAARLEPTMPAIVVGHAHLFGAKIGAERLLTMGSDPMYDARTFDLPNIDYVALGHIHKHQVMHYARPPMVYAGSIERIDFGEEHEEKGWVLVEIGDKGHAEWEFRKLDARRFVTIEARVESDNATEDVLRAIAREADRLAGAVVKLRIDVPGERVAELREDALQQRLKAAYFVAPIERAVKQRVRNRWGATAATIQRASPLEALGLYLEHQKVESDRREVLLRYARALMNSEAGE